MRVLIAALLLIVAWRHVGDVTRSERALFDLFNTLPANLEPVFRSLYRLGTLWAVALVVAAAVLGSRWRLARDLLVAGVLAWATARALGQIVVAHQGFAHSVRIATRIGSSPHFPAVRVAVTVAVIGAAAPYVTRPTRWFGRALVLCLAVSALYLGTAFPDDLFAAVVLGWGVASLVHLIFGSPGSRPTIPQVTDALARLGVDARNVGLAEHQPRGSTVVLAEDTDGPLRVKVIGRDETQARLLHKLWVAVMYKEAGPRLVWTRAERVEHEAYLILVAAQAGVNVPEVVVAGSGGPRAALLVQRPVPGPRLAELDETSLDDDLLTQLWQNVAALHRARVVHNELDAEHIFVADGKPWLVGFDAAMLTGSAEQMASDTAEVLVATSAIVGVDRAVAAALGVLGRSELAAALPFLQPAALTSSNRELAGERHRELVNRLALLREAGAAAAGIEAPELQQLRRVTLTNAGMAIGALVAIAVLLSDLGDPGSMWATLRSADWSWIALAMALSLISNVAYAVGLQGTVPVRLPLWPTTEVELGMSFSNLAIPGIGGQGMQVRYLQKMGVDLSSAIAAGGVLSAFGGLVASLGLFVLALAIDPARVNLSLIPTNGLLLLTIIVVAVVGVASGVVAAIPKLRNAVMPPLVRALTTIWTAVRSPHQLVLLIGGNVMATLLSTWCLMACLLAFGAHTSFWGLLAANIGVVTIASIVPIPGGGTAVGTVGLSAVLVSFGVSRDVAVAAVLANQLVYYYLPAIPGWFATRHLAQHDYL